MMLNSNENNKGETATATNDKDAVLMKWLTNKFPRAVVNGIGVGNDRNGLRGLVVTRQAEKGDILLSIPLEACWITAGSELNNAGKEAVEWTATLPKKVQLALLVLEGWRQQQHPSEDYYWKPFLDSWPDAVPGLPEHLSLEELEREAQCQQLVEATKKHMSWVLSNYAAVQKLAPPTGNNNPLGMADDVDLPTFRKALQLVASRSIRVSAGSSILVPLLDLANHDADPSATYNLCSSKHHLNNDDGKHSSIQLVAERPLAAGDGVTIFYGDHANQLMAGCYGFIPQPNPYNVEHLSLRQVLEAAGMHDDDDDDGSKTITQQIDSVSQMGLPTSNFRLSSGGLIDGNLWLALRVALGSNQSDDELCEILEAIEMDEADEDDLWESDYDNPNEVITRASILQNACAVLEMNEATTTIQEDEAALLVHDNNMSLELGVLVQLRLERKRLFRKVRRNMATVMEDPSRAMGFLMLD